MWMKVSRRSLAPAADRKMNDMSIDVEAPKDSETSQESPPPAPEPSSEPASRKPSVEAYDPHFGKHLKEDLFRSL
jgi:hypothetical protein